LLASFLTLTFLGLISKLTTLKIYIPRLKKERKIVVGGLINI